MCVCDGEGERGGGGVCVCVMWFVMQVSREGVSCNAMFEM